MNEEVNKWADVAKKSESEEIKSEEKDGVSLEEIKKLREELFLAKADLQNAHRRFDRDLDNAYKYSIDKLVQELIPIIDSLEAGLKVQLAECADDFTKQLRTGMELTLSMLFKVLQKYGVKQIDPVGEVFNPAYHEAVATQKSETEKPNVVLSVMQKGYLLKERVVRPALVIVST